MSTFIEMIPTEHSTKVTDFVRVDDDLRCTIRVTDGGTPTTNYYNFVGVEEGSVYSPSNNPNIPRVLVTKEGTDESATISVNMFYAAGSAGDNLPRAWVYGNAFTNPDSGDEVKTTFKDEDLLSGSFTQSFPVIIWNPTKLKPSELPSANSVPTSYTRRSLYTRLRSIADRRQHLKNNIRDYIESPYFPLWIAGSTSHAIWNSSRDIIHNRRVQSFVWYLEMLTRAISIDANLNTEAKFNLLNGMSTLDGGELVKKIDYIVLGAQNGVPNPLTEDRASWTFRRLGSVAATTPFAYTAPTTVTRSAGIVADNAVGNWLAVIDSSITMTNARVGTDWLNYLRI